MTALSSKSEEKLYQKLKNIDVDNPLCSYTRERCKRLAPLVDRILEVKKLKNAIILAHSYIHPDIIYGVADHVGDSYELAKKALQAKADIIIFPAVRFMVETAKILNPEKTVIDPNPNGGCSLADSISQEQVFKLKEKYPDYTFVCYINTTAAVKAACDVCVTSSNVYKIIENIPNNKIYFLPDKLMGLNVQNYLKEKGSKKELLLYLPGTCYVHEEYDPNQIDQIRAFHPSIVILAHPECKPEVIQKADVVGSTSTMFNYVKSHRNEKSKFFLLTECGIASRLKAEYPELQMVGSCMLCKYMRSNSLENILNALENPKPEEIIEVDKTTREGALKCLEAMFYYAEK